MGRRCRSALVGGGGGGGAAGLAVRSLEGRGAQKESAGTPREAQGWAGGGPWREQEGSLEKLRRISLGVEEVLGGVSEARAKWGGRGGGRRQKPTWKTGEEKGSKSPQA